MWQLFPAGPRVLELDLNPASKLAKPFAECPVPAGTGPQFLLDVVVHYHLKDFFGEFCQRPLMTLWSSCTMKCDPVLKCFVPLCAEMNTLSNGI